MSDEDAFRIYARFDWLESTSGRSRLHAPDAYGFDGWCATDVTFACGCHVDLAGIPGFSSRLSTPRCKPCCDRLGIPYGNGSPKNDDQCRRILGFDQEQP